MEKSGNSKILQAIYVQKHSFSNIYCFRFLFKDKISKHKYIYKIFELSMGESQGKVSEKSGNFEKILSGNPELFLEPSEPCRLRRACAASC